MVVGLCHFVVCVCVCVCACVRACVRACVCVCVCVSLGFLFLCYKFVFFVISHGVFSFYRLFAWRFFVPK